jgi:superfamily II DNA helicase RecQ
MKCLKLSRRTLNFFQGELVQPEIWIMRVTMASLLAPNLDLLDFYATKEIIPDKQVVPTLIYSGTQTRTYTVLQVLGMACGTAGSCDNPDDLFARRYHSVTGEKDKQEIVKEYVDGNFPIISATMALGLGQNWKRVWCVFHMGRGDPANIAQMIGR